MGYGGGDLLRTGAVWPAVGSLPGLCVQAVGSGLCGQRLWARDESTLEVAPPDRRPSAFTTMCYTNRQPLPLFAFTFYIQSIVIGLTV